jgi:hypothetical protein
METRFISGARARLKPLVACLGLALAMGTGFAPAPASAEVSQQFDHRQPLPIVSTKTLEQRLASGDPLAARAAAALANARPPRPDGGISIPVSNCDDDGVGSLRDAVENIAASGDTVDMAGLACSTITLTSGAIFVAVDDLTILGPGDNLSSVTIDGNYNGEVFVHLGVGTLDLEDMTILNGAKYTTDDSNAPGGGIYSQGSVALLDSGVKYCIAEAQGTGTAMGGGVYAKLGFNAIRSTISGNIARGTTERASGGGVFTQGTFFAKYDWFRNNSAEVSSLGAYGYGGAIWSNGDATLLNSTISANSAGVVAGADLIGTGSTQQLEIGNTTITDNYAYHSGYGSGLYVGTASTVSNCTITGNVEKNTSDTKYGAGINIGIFASLTLQSSIVSANTIDSASGYLPDDIGAVGLGTLSGGANNLIGYAVTPVEMPPDTIVTFDPGLGPLGQNGGPTPTMVPLYSSLAINHGNNVNGGKYDQRGPGYPRVVGSNADIGAVETDVIFANGFD